MDLLDRLLKNSNYWIRFELGLSPLEGKAYFEEVYYRATTIFKAMFDEDDEILIVNRISKPIDVNKMDRPRLMRFIKNRKQLYGLTCKTIPFEFDEESTEMETKQYSVKVKKADLRLGYLIQALANIDFGRKPRVNGSFYLLNLTKKTLFHMYDDRGCDVFSIEKEKLLPIYFKYRNWILDYNRIEIDRIFEQGLFNVYETSEEMKKRLELNEKKVKKTGINLYKDNTCYITHELEIPKISKSDFLTEIKQTGFEINVTQELTDSIIVTAIKKEALALVDYQTELMALYAKKYKGTYNGWSVIKAFRNGV